MSGPARKLVKLVAGVADVVRPPPPGVTILLYHRVGGGSALEVDLPVELFEAQVAELADRHRVITLDEAVDLLAGRSASDDEGAGRVVITFDDGTADVIDRALPVLHAHGLPATLFVATDFVERQVPFPDDGTPVSWAALSDAVSAGLLTVGSHTHTHALLDRIGVADAEDELDRSQNLIRDRLGSECHHFAYPKALVGTPEAAAAVRRRFRSAALAGNRPNRVGATDPHRLARSPVQVSDGMRWFRHKARGGMAFEDSVRGLVNRRRYASLSH